LTSLEGRVIRRRQAIDAPAGVRSELWIMHELATRLDAPGTYSIVPAEVFDELARASEGGIADYSGLSHELLDTEVAAYWPYPSGSTGTPRLFAESFAHPDGLARLVSVTTRPKPAPSDMLTLVTGRLLEHYQSGAQTRRVPELMGAKPRATVQIHPDTASALGIVHGHAVTVSNERATVHCLAELTDDVRHDTVFLPFHYADSESANLLTESVTDPISGMPEFKKTSVRVAPVHEREL
jgi:assimilatory nitrate reductase catalytic subunit